MSFELIPSPRLPVLVRVYTDQGEISEKLTRNFSAAVGWVRHHASKGHWYGKVQRVEYEYYKNYRGE